MNYREFRPRPQLARFIEAFWILEGAGNGPQRIFPDGCSEIILNFGDPFHQVHDDGVRHPQPRSFLVGQMLRPIVVEPSARAGVFGIRFHPGGAAAFFRVPQHELTDRMTGLDLLWGSELTQRVLDAATDTERVASVEACLAPRIARSPDALVEAAVAAILAAGGALSIESLATRLGTSRRRLERHFQTDAGLTPKHLARIIRFHRVLRAMERPWGHRAVDLALDAGYSDQAHFIREFKEFTGLTPASYFPDQQPLADYFARKNR